jgi:HEAT repeat protein
MSENTFPLDLDRPLASQDAQINWQQVCRVMLKRSLPINPFTTQPDEIDRGATPINLSLGLIETPKREEFRNKVVPGASLPGENPQGDSIVKTYRLEEFLEKVLRQGKSRSQGRRLAVIGESGTGKTLLLQKVAQWILANTEDVPIWISIGQLGITPVYQYLQEEWLQQAAQNSGQLPIQWRIAFEQLLKSGTVWLLLDGVEAMSVSPLAILLRQLQGWADQVRVILTCRPQIWETDRQALAIFDTYQTLEFTEAEVRQFIEQWFNLGTPETGVLSLAEPTLANPIGVQLYQALAQPGKESIRAWMHNPLRLALLCRFWQQEPSRLSDTKAELYQYLVAQFYQWKAELVSTTAYQHQQLNEVLGKLALRAMQVENSPGQISNQLISEIFGENTPWFRLAIHLGWLECVGRVGEKPDDKVYAFFDKTFQDYFAASALDDWRFFFNPSLQVASGTYRIFEPQWQSVFLFWLGRQDVALEDKEALLKALVTFEDRCAQENFYGKRAYFLAAAGLAEFPACSRSHEIVTQLIAWGFAHPPANEAKPWNDPIAQAARTMLDETHRLSAIALLGNRLRSARTETIPAEVFEHFQRIAQGNREAIAICESLLQETTTSQMRLQVADCLGKISPGHPSAIAAVLKLLQTQEATDIWQSAFKSLESIGKGNPQAIASLTQLIQASQKEAIQRQAFQTLEVIGQGNATAIATLVQLIRTTSDPSLQRQAAESLEKIDPGNSTAIALLIELAQEADREDLRRQAIYSLGELESSSPAAIEALVKLLQPMQDTFCRWLAISSLGKIGSGHPQAIEALVKLIQSTNQSELQREAIDSLSKIDPGNPIAIAALIDLIQPHHERSIRQEAAEKLGNLNPGNLQAIAALVQLLHATADEFTRRQAAASLGSIDPGNPEAMATLVQLVQSTHDGDIRSLAMDSLGEMGSNHPAAIATTIRLMQITQDKDTLRRTVKSLGKIAKGNRNAVLALVKLLQSCTDESHRLEIADSLIQMLSLQHMAAVVKNLRDTRLERAIGSDLAGRKVLWYCAQHLPYPEFFQAWHRGNSELVASNLRQILNRAIKEDRDLSQAVRLIYIDGHEFIDPENPSVEIYDQMLAQNCPEFKHGLPDSMAKLRLYWNLLRRDCPQQLLVLVFYNPLTDSEIQGFSPIFLKMLSQFQGAICAIAEHPLVELQSFSPSQPQFLPALLNWMRDKLEK